MEEIDWINLSSRASREKLRLFRNYTKLHESKNQKQQQKKT